MLPNTSHPYLHKLAYYTGKCPQLSKKGNWKYLKICTLIEIFLQYFTIRQAIYLCRSNVSAIECQIRLIQCFLEDTIFLLQSGCRKSYPVIEMDKCCSEILVYNQTIQTYNLVNCIKVLLKKCYKYVQFGCTMYRVFTQPDILYGFNILTHSSL